MHYCIHARESTLDGSWITHVRDLQIGPEFLAFVGGMDVLSQRVQHQDLMTAIRQLPPYVLSDKARASRQKNSHDLLLPLILGMPMVLARHVGRLSLQF